jgi:hypothetical protein
VNYPIEIITFCHGGAFWAFDLLEVDGRVLATSPLLERRRELTYVFETPPGGYLLSETFEDAKALLRAADRFGLEGIVSKRKEMGYRSGTSSHWVKVKTSAWRKAHEERWKLSNPPKGRRFTVFDTAKLKQTLKLP